MWKFFTHRTVDETMGVFRRVPLATKGRLYVSPMPFGAYDTRNRLLKFYRDKNVKHVFIIATDDEIHRKSQRNIKEEYRRIGATYHQLAIPDMTAPDLITVRAVVTDAVGRLANENIAVHCHAGVGRTSVVVCCIVHTITGMPAAETIAFVKNHMSVNMTAEQASVVTRFAGNHPP